MTHALTCRLLLGGCFKCIGSGPALSGSKKSKSIYSIRRCMYREGNAADDHTKSTSLEAMATIAFSMSIIYFPLAFLPSPLPSRDAISRRCPSHPEDFLIAAEEIAANYLGPTLGRVRIEQRRRSCFPDVDLAAFLQAFSYLYSNSKSDLSWT